MNKQQRFEEQIAVNGINFKAMHMKVLRRRLASVAYNDKFNRVDDGAMNIDAQIDLTVDSMNITKLN